MSVVWFGRQGARASLQALGCATLLLAPLAWSEELSVVRVDQVRVLPSGRHQVWVSVLDPRGRPLEGIDPAAFSVNEDGRPVDRFEGRAWGELHRELHLTLVVDPGLLRGSDLVALERAVVLLGSELGPGARLRVVAAGARMRVDEGPSGSTEALARGMGRLVGESGESRIYDALVAEERRLLRKGHATGVAIVVIGRGAEETSRAGPLQALGLLAGQDRRVPVLLVLVEDQGSAPEAERLARLAARTGGAVRRVARAAGVEDAIRELIPRARSGWRLSYRVPGFERRAKSHRLEIRVEHGGRRREVTHEFDSAEALLPPWWRRPAPWVWLGATLLALGVAALVLRQRPLFLLVVESGPERGCWYQVFVTPVTLGAAPGNDLLVAESSVSRNHAVLERRRRSIEIVDLNSENGTFVNGERVTRRVLADGDTIQIGSAVQMTFQG